MNFLNHISSLQSISIDQGYLNYMYFTFAPYHAILISPPKSVEHKQSAFHPAPLCYSINNQSQNFPHVLFIFSMCMRY